jgi:predicted phosphodiesterase
MAKTNLPGSERAVKRLSMTGPLAVFSDVHGNLPGLEAILADAARRGVTNVVCLGDLVGYGPFPNEVATLVRERAIPTVMGNYDQGIGFATGDCGCVYKTDEQRAEGAASLHWTEQATSPETRAYLRTLEDRLVLDTPAGELLAVHGSPRRINEYLFADRPESSLARIAAAEPYRAIVFGHTHLPYVRESGGTTFVNVGSGGRPKDGDWRVCYALIDPRPAADGGLAVEFVRLAFDYERLAAALAGTTLTTTFDGPAAKHMG